MKLKSLVIGMVVGGVVGATSTLLSTPASGREVRNQLKESKDQWRNVIEELKTNVTDLKNSLQHLSAEGKDTVSKLSADLKVTIQQWKEQTEPHSKRIQEELDLIQNTLSQLETSINNKQNPSE